MSPRHLLIKAITLFFLESQVEGLSERSLPLMEEVLTTIKLPEAGLGLIDSERDIIAGLYGLALKMGRDSVTTQYELGDLLQQVRMHVSTEIDLYEAFKEGLLVELTPEQLKKRCVSIRREFRDHIMDYNTDRIINDAAYMLKFKSSEIVDKNTFIREISAKLDNISQGSKTADAAIKGTMDFGDIDSLTNVFETVVEDSTGMTLLKTGLQDFNDMIGGGFKRGNFVLFSALQHNNKTGFTLDMFRHIAIYNTPVLDDPKKKPLLLRISFEDEIDVNAKQLIAKVQELRTGLPFIVRQGETDEEKLEIAKEVAKEFGKELMDELTKTGWHVIMHRVDPTKWTIFDLFSMILDLEADGYEIHVCMVDYLKMLPTTGCFQGAMGQDIRDMFRRCRNFFSP